MRPFAIRTPTLKALTALAAAALPWLAGCAAAPPPASAPAPGAPRTAAGGTAAAGHAAAGSTAPSAGAASSGIGSAAAPAGSAAVPAGSAAVPAGSAAVPAGSAAVPAGSAAAPAAAGTAGAATAGHAAAGAAPPAAAEADPHSFARPAEVAVDHLALDLTVDFAARRLSGRASLRLRARPGADTLVLDTRDLDVQRVTLADGKTDAPFTLGDPVPILGRPLSIHLPPGTAWVNVDYATRPEAAALQWLTSAQAGSSLPLLYTQSEAILARTWVPCQDTPSVRQTYEATVRVPPGMLALMSAENPTVATADGVYRFRMPQSIPSYLLALAVGDLRWQSLSARSGVYALPGVLDRAAWELADTPRMIDAAEKLAGPYRWGRYDLLVLPPSDPYGGMENPRLTFTTPTILAGDRSLVSVVAHELAHSWSGNLVTNASWNDVWLNEGITVYLERRIMEALHGKDYADMLAVLGRQDLDETVRAMGPENPDTRLHLDLAGRDPDADGAGVAYERGALFLATVEASVGRERFDRFLRGYFDANAFQSIDTRRFAAYLRAHLLDASPGLAESLRLDEWLYGPGVPATAIRVRSAALARVDRTAADFAAGAAAAQLDTNAWTTLHWLRFLQDMPQPLAPARMAELDAAFHLTDTGNDEILDAWLLLAVRNAYAPATAALDHFLTTVGRRKYLQPLYTELAKTPAGAETALRIYTRARPGYHPITQAAIDKILDWQG